MLLVVAGVWVAGELRYRAVVRRAEALPSGTRPMARLRTASRGLAPLTLLLLAGMLACGALVVPAERAGVPLVLATAAALAAICGLIVVLAVLGNRLRWQILGRGLSTGGLATALARTGVAWVAGFLLVAGPALLVLVLWLRGFPRLPVLVGAALAFAALISSGAALYLVSPLAVRWVHRAAPIDLPDLADRIRRLEAVSHTRLGVVHRVPDVPFANAGVTGTWHRLRLILVTDLLLEVAGPEDIVAILAHEIAHVQCRHLLRRSVWMIPRAAIFMIVMFAVTLMARWLGFTRGPAPTMIGAVVASLLVALSVEMPGSRRHELEADRLAAQWVGTDVYVRALRLLHETNATEIEPARWEALLSTHPSLQKRVSALDDPPRRDRPLGL